MRIRTALLAVMLGGAVVASSACAPPATPPPPQLEFTGPIDSAREQCNPRIYDGVNDTRFLAANEWSYETPSFVSLRRFSSAMRANPCGGSATDVWAFVLFVDETGSGPNPAPISARQYTLGTAGTVETSVFMPLCGNAVNGTVNVLAVERGENLSPYPGQSVTRFDADFDITCRTGEKVQGRVRYTR